MSGNHHSAVVIARLLNTEGYTEELHQAIELWWKHVVMHPRDAKHVAKLERDFSTFIREVTEDDVDYDGRADRKLVGQFIGMKRDQSFEAGFRLGFQALLFNNGLHPIPTKQDKEFKRRLTRKTKE